MVKMYSLLCMAAVAVEMSLAQIFVKVSVAVAAGADDHILLPCFKCC